MKALTIAIDGPAASGKSTTAEAVARELGYGHLNSGLLYRAVTWAALTRGWAFTREELIRQLEDLDLELRRQGGGFGVRVDGVDPAEDLTSREVSAAVSTIAAVPEVRERVLVLLRAEGGRGGVVCDGRDIGTAVFPDAELKIFLVADAEERGRRRLLEQGIEPSGEALQAEVGRLERRDALDAGRAVSPLKRAADAVELDTTRLGPREVVEAIVELARRREAELG